MIEDVLAGGAGLLFDGIGSLFAESEEEKRRKLIEQMLAEYNNVSVPSIESQMVTPEAYTSVGNYNPEMASVYTQGPTEFENIVQDPRARDAQMDALDALTEVGQNGGLRLSDKAALEQVKNEVASADKGRRDAILAREQRRGRGGSGFELASLLQGSQTASNNASQQGMDIAGSAADRALDALAGAGTLGGQIRGQDFTQASAKATAADAINKFNTANKNTIGVTNTGALNEGQQYNLGNRQTIANNNVTTRNNAQVRNKDLVQQQFGNQMQLSSARNTARSGGAAYYGDQANATRRRAGAVGQGVGQAVYGLLEDEE